MAEPSISPGFTEALTDAVESWMEHHNARVRAERINPHDRDQFMPDIGAGWIVPDPYNKEGAIVDWGLFKGGVEAASPDPSKQRAMAHALRKDSWRAGAYMGKGSLGTPVYVGPGKYGASFTRKTNENDRYEGKMGLFAPEGRFIRAGAETGTIGHELGHAKQKIMAGGHRDKFYRKSMIGGYDASHAADEAVASYLGRRIIRSKGGWGAAAEDKSWAAYSGLPSYLRSLDEDQTQKFLKVVGWYEDQYPGIADEVNRAIREYDTLVAPKTINDTSRGDWSEEGLEFMKKWRKGKGLREVPKGGLYERALDMGPYSQALQRSRGFMLS